MRPKKSITCQELLELVPDQLVECVAKETNVDYSVSKLTGRNMFALLLYGLISGKEVSLKILEDVFRSPLLQAVSGGKTIEKSSLSYRLKTMNPDFFKHIFDHLATDERVGRYMGIVQNKYVVKKVDSTIVTLTSKLLTVGMDIFDGRKDLKFSVGIMDGLPIEIELFTTQTYASEDIALPEIIHRKRPQQKEKITIVLFDRGVQSRDTLESIRQEKQLFFVTRLSSQGYMVDRIHKEIAGRSAGELLLVSDDVIHFESSKEKRSGEFRLVTARHPTTGQDYHFLTDIFFLTATEICQLYKERWEIETFFKFIKQQLNFSHLVSRSKNGITIIMYMTMIAAILIAIYKKINHIETWGSTQRRFIYELEANVLKIFFPYYAPAWGYERKTSRRLDGF
jgi:transposase